MDKTLLPKDKRLLPKEGEEQARLFSWAELEMARGRMPELRLMFHVPNGGARSKAEAARFKAEGVKPGGPDICPPVPRGEDHGLWIEMKRLAGGRASADQKKWMQDLREQGYRAEICEGWQAAAAVIKDYLEVT